MTKQKQSIDIGEQILLMRLAWGDRTAFWQLWIQYQQQIYYCCHARMRSNYDDTEYAFNQVMLKVWHRLPDVAEKITNLQAWLSRITNNVCMEVYQERKQIAQCIENFDLDRDAKSSAAALQSQYSHTWQPSQAAIACSEWKKYIYLTLDWLSSGRY
ncbi:MAG: hypothetical protein QNJ36_13370 [Calothrix sp. MO_167.B42]|nr:hypothetical protein [Calothrix sp. MO_167.B42]